MSKPIEIHFYDPKTDEVKATFVRSFVPWAILKKAMKLQKAVQGAEFTEEYVDELAGLVVAVFGDQFTIEDVNNGMDVGEMLTVLSEVITRAAQIVTARGNPTTAA